jgi:hypothetical protein
MWPEVWNGLGDARRHYAIQACREKVERRAVRDRAARKPKIIRDRSEVRDPIDEAEAPAALAMAAIGIFDFAAWKPWLNEVCNLCDLQVPEMPLLEDHIADHLQPPKRRQKYSKCHGTAALLDRCSKMKSDVVPARRLRGGKSGTDYV